METIDSGVVHGASEGGIVADHPDAETQPALVGTSTGNEFNTLIEPLAPIACCSIQHARFEFDSSFIGPKTATELHGLAVLMDRHKDKNTGDKPLLSIFGHADTTGPDDYNKVLSGRRARAVHALLLRKTEVWEELYSEHFGGDRWGLAAIQIMLNTIGAVKCGVTGNMDESTRQSVHAFQQSDKGVGLRPDGDPGPATRKKLFLAYMDFLCGNDPRLEFTPQSFLGHGKDPGGKGDVQGCGDFNPILVFAAAEQAVLSTPANRARRNLQNAPNRRVVVFLFRPDAKIDPAKWPCPHVKDGSGGCIKRLWSDARKRRQPGPERRLFEHTRDTFACRFYHRLALESPCERVIPLLKIRLFDEAGKLLVGAPFRLTAPPKIIEGLSDGNGDAIAFDVPVPSTCIIEWSRSAAREKPKSDPAPAQIRHFGAERPKRNAESDSGVPKTRVFDFELEVFVDLTDDDTPTDLPLTTDGAVRRLHNLGYSTGSSLEENIRTFQRDAGVPEGQRTGKVTSIEGQLRIQHDDLCQPPGATGTPTQ